MSPPEIIEIVGPGQASAKLSTHGATLLSWKNTAGKELLFVSSKAILDGSKAIRGGVPVCFPQFGMLGPLPTQHGFARTARWEVVERPSPASATLRLGSHQATLEAWPHRFELRMMVTVGDDTLKQELTVQNVDDKPMEFTCALHTYFSVSAIDNASVIGLGGCAYHDNLSGQRQSQSGGTGGITFGGEVDRVYIGAPDALKVADAGSSCAVMVRKHGLADAVVWNPWTEKAKALTDLGDEDYLRFCCLEVAQARSGAVALGPGDEWVGGQVLEYVEHTDM